MRQAVTIGMLLAAGAALFAGSALAAHPADGKYAFDCSKPATIIEATFDFPKVSPAASFKYQGKTYSADYFVLVGMGSHPPPPFRGAVFFPKAAPWPKLHDLQLWTDDNGATFYMLENGDGNRRLARCR